MNATHFNITAVERDTGLSKDVLRMWERRYGFPVPERDANGERCYPPEQVERLRLIKRLMDAGHRPGKLIATPVAELAVLAPRRKEQIRSADPVAAGELDELLSLIKRHDVAAYQQAMQQRLARQAVATLPTGPRDPRILLTSVPDEQHVLGLLMVEALFALEGAECIPLGTQMPLLEISRAATAHRADIVALSFSVAFPQRQIPMLLQQLRAALPDEVALWVGGGGIRRLADVPGIKRLVTLEDATAALAVWRAGER